MRRLIMAVIILLVASQWRLPADDVFNAIPSRWHWTGRHGLVFSYASPDMAGFVLDAASGKRREMAAPDGLQTPQGPPPGHRPEGSPGGDDRLNETFSPDSCMLAYTKANDLYVRILATGEEKRLTFDGSADIFNGYAAWVYYEEIFGRPSRYKAFWWSPDSKKLAFYRFDNTGVPVFSIYSHKGQDGEWKDCAYPKAGEPNPKVKICIADCGSGELTWADFDYSWEGYYGTPFWGADSGALFVSREPRLQNSLELFSVAASDGSIKSIYSETYSTWIDWIEGMLFTSDGLYMVRNFETGWQQIYFLSYDGSVFRRLTDGPNWRCTLRHVDEKSGKVYFTAERDSRVRQALYSVDKKGNITAISDTSRHVASVSISPDGKYAVGMESNYTTPSQIWVYDLNNPVRSYKVADERGENYNAACYALPELVTITTRDGLVIPASITLPLDFDPTQKYPVHVDIYGGPDTPQVTDRWSRPSANNQWWSENGIIQVVADCRAAGHNGREGLDKIYRQLGKYEALDFVDWAGYLKSLPYVNGDKIGVEGFSFGGTMTARLVIDYPEAYHYGIAGGGVYDWALYDTHYTERFMDTPENNPDGYAGARVADHAASYVTDYSAPAAAIEPVMLKITHGTGDDNVHFQNTLYLADALIEAGKKFELMVYPDGMHGYRGKQGEHFNEANRDFWLKYLLSDRTPVGTDPEY